MDGSATTSDQRRGVAALGDASLFDLLPLPAYIFDDHSLKFLAVNRAALERYGYARDEFLNLSLDDIRSLADRSRCRDVVRERLDDARDRGDWQHQTKSGGVFRVEVVSQPVVYQDRAAHCVVVWDTAASEGMQEAQRQAEKGLIALNEQLRRVSSRARARREEDRTRLARELHDQLGQALAALKIDLCWLGQQVETGSAPPDELSAKIDAMTRLADDTIFRVRRISSELRPPVLDRLGLVAAIEWQIEEFQKRSGIHVRMRSRLEHLPLDLGRSTAVFRIFQEALSNVETHAHATQVTVRVSTPGQRFVLAVADNGGGIPSEQAASSGALGLVGMRERAALLGGTVHVRPGRTHGTIVSVSIPLAERRRTSRDPTL